MNPELIVKAAMFDQLCELILARHRVEMLSEKLAASETELAGLRKKPEAPNAVQPTEAAPSAGDQQAA